MKIFTVFASLALVGCGAVPEEEATDNYDAAYDAIADTGFEDRIVELEAQVIDHENQIVDLERQIQEANARADDAEAALANIEAQLY